MSASPTPNPHNHSPERSGEIQQGNYRGPERRRQSWSAFRESYPTFLKVTTTLFLLLVAANMWLIYRRAAYRTEIERLRGEMSQAEREKSDLVIQSEKDKLRIAVELAKRQARWDPQLHLSIAVDSGVMYLERDGALLREMRVVVGPTILPGVDTPVMTALRGERTIEQVSKDQGTQLFLTGGTRIYASTDTTQVAPGSVRISPTDMKAILGNINPGMVVYFY